MKASQWVIIAVVAVVAVLIGAALGPLFLWHGGLGYRGMLGGYDRGMTLAPHASAGVGGFRFAQFGWIGLLMMGAFPLGLLVLALIGLILLVRVTSRPAAQPSVVPARVCPNCRRPVQADWRNCPYCGTALQQNAPSTGT